MDVVGGDDHPPGGDFVADLLGASDAARARRRASSRGVMMPRRACSSCVIGHEARGRRWRESPSRVQPAGRKSHAVFVARRRHAGRVGRRERERAADVRRVRERARVGAFACGSTDLRRHAAAGFWSTFACSLVGGTQDGDAELRQRRFPTPVQTGSGSTGTSQRSLGPRPERERSLSEWPAGASLSRPQGRKSAGASAVPGRRWLRDRRQ